METEKKAYNTPNIERVALDNEISLVLVSSDPGEPGKQVQNVFPNYDTANPFKTDKT